jgi:carbamoyl-phosphate synthase large subunit
MKRATPAAMATLNVELLKADDPAWERWLDGVPRDIYHTAAYHRYARDSGDGEPYLIVVGDRGRGMAWPYLLRDVETLGTPGGSSVTDVTSVYGYSGPLAWGSKPWDPFVRRAWAEFLRVWRQQGVVSVFTRFHPLLGNAALAVGLQAVPGIQGRDAGLVEGGPTVSIDLGKGADAAREEYGRDLLRRIRLARRKGLATTDDVNWDELPAFARLYKATMIRNGATGFYFFNESDFGRLRHELHGAVHLLVTRLGDEVAAAGIFTQFNDIVECHLLGSDDTLLALSPTKVLLDDAVGWAVGRGARVLHVGGGRGGHDDSLLWFKASFSRRFHQFHTGRWILDPARYQALEVARLASESDPLLVDQSFFPAYRAPLLTPEVASHDLGALHVERPSTKAKGRDGDGASTMRAVEIGKRVLIGGSNGRNVLVTAAGRRTTLVMAFADEARKRGGRTYAGDVDPLAPALFLADEAIRLHATDDPAYLTDLTEIIGRCGIGLLVPTIDPDLPLLARNRTALRSMGCVAAVSDESFIAITSDKFATVSTFGARGVAVPASWLPGDARTDLPDPIFIKPRHGSASQDARMVPRSELDRVAIGIRDPIIQEVLTGPEITIDALLDLDGHPVHYVPRTRLRTLGGESIQGVTLEHDRHLEAWIERLLEICGSLGASGPLCLQAFLEERGPVLSEINARFGGGFPLALAAGGAYSAWLLDMVEGIRVPSRLGVYESGLYMTRYNVEYFTRSLMW